MEELLARIPQLVAARYPLIWVQSAEEDRVERGIARLATSQGTQLFRWRSTTGLQCGLGPDAAFLPETRSILSALAHVGQVTAPAIFLFEDCAAELVDPGVVRRLRDLEPDLEQRKQALVFVSHTAQIPQELEKDIAVLDAPLPDRKDIGKLLSKLLTSQGIPVPPDRFEQFATASLGLTEKEIKRAYARMLLEGRRFEDKDVAALLDEKARMLRRSRFLEFIKPDMGMSQVGGLENLKVWLNERTPSFSDRARQYGLPEPKGLFLLGVQGCGKSLSAKAVADLWHLPLLRLDVAALFAGRAEEGLRDTIPLAVTMDDRLKELREWARPRARPASVDTRRAAFFQDWASEESNE